MLRLVLSAAVAALAATAPAASAEPLCVGTEEDLVVCVDPEGVPQPGLGDPLVSRCVVLPTEPGCTPVAVPSVVLYDGEGRLLSCNDQSCLGLVPTPCEPLPRGALGTVCAFIQSHSKASTDASVSASSGRLSSR